MAGAKRVPSSLVQLMTTIGCLRPDAEVVERADHLEPAEHAEHAVIAPAGRLGVEVAADIDRQRVGSVPSRAREHGAHLVDAHAAGRRPRTSA